MNIPTRQNFTGALFTHRRENEGDVSIDWSSAVDGLQTQKLSDTGWTAFSLTSAVPLADESPLFAQTMQSFTYYFLFRRGQHNRFLLLGTHPKLVPNLLSQAGVADNYRTPRIDTVRLARTLVEKPARYAMSAAHARVDGYGQSLRSCSLYGHDLGDALMFVELLDRLTITRVSLRDIPRRLDVLSAGAHGDISFMYTGSTSLRYADEALRFLTERHFLDWTLSPGIEDGGPPWQTSD